MNSQLISTHVFLYYDQSGKYVLDELSKIYSGKIYLSLVHGNPNNDKLLKFATQKFNVELVYVDDYGTDQYGFYHSFQLDKQEKPWIFYCHDKSQNKMDWLQDIIKPFHDLDNELLLKDNIGIISSQKYKYTTIPPDALIAQYANIAYENRKNLIQSMHTLIWLHELEKILWLKYELGEKDIKYPVFSAGNIFLIRRSVLEKAHGCIYENYFNKGYRSDGEVEHGMERFYYYVSTCMKYNNIFI